MVVIVLGVLALLVPIWIFCVIGKFIAQFTGSDFMEDWPWAAVLAPIWLPALLLILIFLGSMVLVVIFKFGFGLSF